MKKHKNYIAIGIITLVLVVGLSIFGVRAVERYGTVTINNVENLTMNVEGSVDGEGAFGASGTRFPNGISADSTSPSAGEVRGTTLTTTGVVTIGGAATIDGALNVSGVTIIEEFTQGGGVLATSTSNTSETLVLSDLSGYNYLEFMPNVGATTYTLPATSTMISLLPADGDTRTWLLHNATSTSGITTTFAAGGGMDLVAVTTDDDLIDEGEWTQLTCTNIYYRDADNEDIMCIVDELTNAD